MVVLPVRIVESDWWMKSYDFQKWSTSTETLLLPTRPWETPSMPAKVMFCHCVGWPTINKKFHKSTCRKKSKSKYRIKKAFVMGFEKNLLISPLDPQSPLLSKQWPLVDWGWPGFPSNYFIVADLPRVDGISENIGYGNYYKLFEGELSTKTLSTTLLQIVC